MSHDKITSCEVLDPAWIEMADGVRLAARIWLPPDARAAPKPAILEYLPYRRRDATVRRDDVNHPWLAANGFACVRVDIRGNGDSGGLMDDEYTEEELADGATVIDWIARQPWCVGKVGMIGISWGGFNGLMIAARRPPALKAIVTVCSTDDRYADDIHMMGGCLLTENMLWSSQMLAYSSRPPDPAIVGDRDGDGWREIWRKRLEHQPLLIEPWLAHQRRDAYWKRGSVCEDYGAITCPVLAVGGWADAYSNAVPRLLAGLPGVAKGLIGPWVHKYPNIAYPAPAIGFLAIVKQWFDRWLSDIPTGAEDWPVLTYHLMDSVSPAARLDRRPGRWTTEAAWPSAGIATRSLRLSEAGLGEAPGKAPLRLDGDLRVGRTAQRFCPGMRDEEGLATDQSADDAFSLVFDTPPLEAPLDIVGAAVLRIRATPDRVAGHLCARLCDVRPDGTVAFVTVGLLNLTHDERHETVIPLVPGKTIDRDVRMNDIAYRVPAGHRLRLSLSTSHWPMIWPAPEILSLEINSAATLLELPLRTAEGPAAPPSGLPLGPADGAPPGADVVLRPSSSERSVEIEPDGTEVRTLVNDGGKLRLAATGIETGHVTREIWALNPSDPLSARTEASWTFEVGRGDWSTRTETWTRMTADATHFHLDASLEAYDGDALFHRREWRTSIRRDGI